MEKPCESAVLQGSRVQQSRQGEGMGRQKEREGEGRLLREGGWGLNGEGGGEEGGGGNGFPFYIISQ